MYGLDLKMPLKYSSLAADHLFQPWVWLYPRKYMELLLQPVV